MLQSLASLFSVIDAKNSEDLSVLKFSNTRFCCFSSSRYKNKLHCISLGLGLKLRQNKKPFSVPGSSDEEFSVFSDALQIQLLIIEVICRLVSH